MGYVGQSVKRVEDPRFIQGKGGYVANLHIPGMVYLAVKRRVQPGDKIYSPNADIFYIQGQVKAPGNFRLTPKMTLSMALARAGGITDLGSSSSIKIIRNNTEMKVRDLNAIIQPNDIIDVGEGWF